MKKMFAVILTAVIMLLPSCGTVENPTEAAVEYLIKNTDTLGIGSIGGDWTAVVLAKAGKGDALLEDYRANVREYVQNKGGVLHSTRYTEYSRTVYALTLLGEDARNISGYNLVKYLFDYDAVSKQGVNGVAWALLALDTAGVDDAEIGDLRKRYIDNILAAQNEDGSIGSFVGSEVDITAMCLRALGAYISRSDVAAACDRAVDYLASRQGESGGFPSPYGEASEPIAQVLLALDAMGCEHNDERFAYSLSDALLDYQNRDGGFAHTLGEKSDRLATEQAAWALIECEIEVEQ